MSFPVTLTHLYAAGIAPEPAKEFLMPLNAAMQEFGINFGERPAMFLAQCCHESGGFHYLSEIWGPTEIQKTYENNKRLGNTSPGDGERYKGHGLIQITGKYNHLAMANFFGVSLWDVCEWLQTTTGACRSAARFWDAACCSTLADHFDFVGVTKKINPGMAGLVDRMRFYKIFADVMEQTG